MKNYVKDLRYEPTDNGKYKITMTIGTAKFYAGESGKEIRVPQINDYIEIGIFSRDSSGEEKELLLRKVKMDQQEKTFEFTVDEKPYSAGADPYLKLIDRRASNNIAVFGSTPPAPNLNEDKTISIQIGTDD
ncbi:MAG: hypothetical protein KL787_09275 [Taibaiella sp.]|nr:hypothetical protein [Taibaiella sp.]